MVLVFHLNVNLRFGGCFVAMKNKFQVVNVNTKISKNMWENT